MATVKTTAGNFGFPGNVQLHRLHQEQKGKSNYYVCTTQAGLEIYRRKTDRLYSAAIVVRAERRAGKYVPNHTTGRMDFVADVPEQWTPIELKPFTDTRFVSFVGHVDLIDKSEAVKRVAYYASAPEFRNITAHIFLLDELHGQLL